MATVLPAQTKKFTTDARTEEGRSPLMGTAFKAKDDQSWNRRYRNFCLMELYI